MLNKNWSFYGAKPFEHWVINDFIDAKTVAAINAEWPLEWYTEEGKNAVKKSTGDLTPAAAAVAAEMQAPEFCEWLSKLVGIPKLLPDPEHFGGGLHCIERGGYLKMHLDFNQRKTEKGTFYRRVNVLVYLNVNWRREWGGQLLLGKEGLQTAIDPLAGLCAIFPTTEKSWHGHPAPLQCPEGVQRRSMALYYYTREEPEGLEDHRRVTSYEGKK